jgi:hypothetical protein
MSVQERNLSIKLIIKKTPAVPEEICCVNLNSHFHNLVRYVHFTFHLKMLKVCAQFRNNNFQSKLSVFFF